MGAMVHGLWLEVVYAARAGAAVGRGDAELDGWYLTYATDPAARVPNGLHGNWIPAEDPIVIGGNAGGLSARMTSESS